jgi:uncharacterized SAM-binding protein YcdF (DUF218 family)
MMFAIQKIMNYIIFPPSIFIIILIPALLFLKNSRKKAVILIICDIILIYFLSIEPVKNLILSPLENFAKPLTDSLAGNADLVVVLGGGTIGSSPEENNSGSLTGDAFKRALYGLYIAEKYKLPLLYSGGKLFDSERQSESEIALKILAKYSSGKIKIHGEDKSRTTYENALYTKEKFNPRKIILVTSAYHMKRSVYVFRKSGLDCVPAPTDYKIDSGKFNVTSYIPKSGEMDMIYRGLKEYAGLIFYSLK